jgi:hypothetical protein
MAATWYEKELKNKNFLSPIGFKLVLDKSPKMAFLCQTANIPSISVGEIDIPTRGLVQYPIDGNIKYGELTLEFLIDENLENYLELHNWMRALGTPNDLQERADWIIDKAIPNARTYAYRSLVSDVTLIALNNNMNAQFECLFKDAFPTNLSTIGFDVTQTDNNFFSAEVTFRYTLYEIRAINSGARRTS